MYLCFYLVSDLSLGNGATHTQGESSNLSYTSLECPHRHAQRCVSFVIPNRTMLMNYRITCQAVMAGGGAGGAEPFRTEWVEAQCRSGPGELKKGAKAPMADVRKFNQSGS